MKITEVRRAMKVIDQVSGETRLYWEDVDQKHQSNVAQRAIVAELDLLRQENNAQMEKINKTLESISAALWSIGNQIEVK